MIHPTQLFTPIKSPPIESPKGKLEDLKNWREGDLLDLVELICELVQSEDWQKNPLAVHEIGNELRLPSSLTTLLLNSLNRLERILITKEVDTIGAIASEMPNVTELAKCLGLGGVFTKEVEAIWQGTKPTKPIAQAPIVTNESEPPTQLPIARIVEVQAYASMECRITTNQTGTGRQWKIGGQLIAEVELTTLGHVGRMFSGSFSNQTRPYREYESAATQCREYTEGVLKLLKTIPR
jgi:hypothetical protein